MDLEVLGIPKHKLKQLRQRGILSLEDLIMFFPKKYLDFRKITPISQVKHGEYMAVVGKIEEIKEYEKLIQTKIADESGRYMYIVWFHQFYIVKKIKRGVRYLFCGKIQIDSEFGTKRMVNPLYVSSDFDRYRRIIPVYPKIKGMSEEYFSNIMQKALYYMPDQETLEEGLIRQFHLMRKKEALFAIHQPRDLQEVEKARYRFVFEELFSLAMQLEANEGASTVSSYSMDKYEVTKKIIDSLPFELTKGQREVLRAIYQKMRKGQKVHALVQGDVGCGKTIIAILLMMIACENGYQAVLMAPTNVLAKQHYRELLERTKDTPYEVVFLSGEMRKKEREGVIKKIKDGSASFVVGTHALLSEEVKFSRLALVIVDEEHRFGVLQRNQLKEKATEGMHYISMSATPIPRSLALHLYGKSVDIFTIRTLPQGRKPVTTIIHSNEEKVYEGILRQVKQGRQCYIVCPLIEDSDSDIFQNVDSVETTYAKITKYFQDHPEIRIAMISGKMKQEEVDEEIKKFSRNETQILVSTTIIEVGVNVPNATVMVIKNAECFGLAQLHQLRGRVGRGEHPSFCVLLSDKKDDPKLQAMCQTTDGFEIAKKDLELRGAGDLVGTRQTGYNPYLPLLLKYPSLYDRIRKEVYQIYKDPIRLGFYQSFFFKTADQRGYIS